MKNNRWLRIAFLMLVVFLTHVSLSIAETITSTSQGGRWDDESTWIGGKLPQVTDDVIITSVVTTGNVSYSSRTFKMANLTVNAGGKIIREADKTGRYSLEIHEDLVNNGEIIDYLDYFDIFIYGNLVNNGVFKPRLVYMKGVAQHISTTKPIECETFNLQMEDDELVAASNLQFKNCYIPSNGSKLLKMGAYNLTLRADSISYDGYYGKVSSASAIRVPLKFEESGTMVLDNSIAGCAVTGNLNIASTSYAFIQDMVVEGDLKIAEGTKISSYRDLQSIRISGDLTNYGDLNKDTVLVGDVVFPPKRMKVYAHGNVVNFGNTGITQMLVNTDGETRTFSGNFNGDVVFQQSEGSDKPGGKVIINDEVNIDGKLDVYADVEIKKGASLNLLYKGYRPIYVRDGQGSITNYGSMRSYNYMNDNWSYRVYEKSPWTSVDFDLRDWEGRIEGVDVEVHNGETYPGLPGSVKRWWRLKPVGDGTPTQIILKLYYDEALLNGQKEENLKVFRSTDEGKNWEVISIGEYATLDTVENSISIGTWSKPESMLSEFGDFVISSGDGSVPIPSPIILKLIGRDKVREGAPNRYTVQMYNVSDTDPSSSFLVSVNLDGDARFLGAEVPTKDSVEVMPVDSIGDADGNTLAFYVPYLNPKEESSFDVIITGIPTTTKSTEVAPVLLWIGGVAIIGTVSVAADYLTDILVDGTDLTEQQKKDVSDVTGIELKVIKAHKKKEDKTTYAMKTTAKSVMQKLSKVHPVTDAAFKVGEKVEQVNKFAPSLRYRFILWAKSWMNQEGRNELRLLNGEEIEAEKVKSLDPNEKIGPRGYGEENYISSAGRMHYTIAFENKKEATAPAYRVQIVDTLSAVFNPETVQFGATSHSSSQYNWQMERVGNVLKWDIEGIELPPNVTPPEGEGFVSFSVELNEGLQSGVPIKNRATIVFDLNEPITTNTWTNILDTIAPMTSMNPVAFSAGDTVVTISCTTTDNENGSGVNGTQFFVSVNNGPFTSIGGSFDNTIEYAISDITIKNYRFYALTTDNVSNAENSIPEFTELNTFLVSAEFVDDFDSNIKLYPNPSSGRVNVEFECLKHSPVELRLYNPMGKAIRIQEKKWYNAGLHKERIDISSLKEGIYFMEIIIDQKSNVYKLVKK